MKNSLLIKLLAFSVLGASLWSCVPSEKIAQTNTEYDDLYYTAADRKAAAELYASTQPQTNLPNNNEENPTMTFDNQNANVDYIDRYQESRLYAGQSLGAETYYDPNFMRNANVPVVGYANPYANNAWGMNAWNNPWGMNAWNNPWGMNAWNTPFNRGGFNMGIGFGFGSMMGMNAWNNPWAMNAWNNPWGWNNFNAWNDPWAMNAWNNPWGWNNFNAWNSPWGWGGASRVIVVNNNRQQIASSYYGPRYNTGGSGTISSENSRIRVRQSRTPAPTEGGEVGGRPAGTDGKPALTTGTVSQPRYGATRSREASSTNSRENGVYIPSTRTQNNSLNRTSPTRNTRTSQDYRTNTRGSNPTYRSTTPTRTSPTYRSTTPTRTSPTYRSNTTSSPTYRSNTTSSPSYRSTTPSRSSSPSRSTSTPSRSRPPR